MRLWALLTVALLACSGEPMPAYASVSGRGGWSNISLPAPGEILIRYANLSFTRSSSAYETQSDGTLILRAPNVRRRNPEGLTYIEGSYTQTLLWNEDQSNAVWTKTNCTISDASFVAPDISKTPKQMVVTANGDASISQLGGFGASGLTMANHNVYLRSDSGSLNVQVALEQGANIAQTNVVVSNSWQRVEAVLRNFTDQPTAFVRILGGTAGQRLAVWGNNIRIGSTARFGHMGSHVPTQGSQVVTARDVLTGVAADVPNHMRTNAWGFYWVPAWPITGTDWEPSVNGLNSHEDITFFSFSVPNEIEEVLWTAYDPASPGQPQIGNVFARNGAIVPKAVGNTLRAAATDTLLVSVSPRTGRVKVTGAVEGSGNGPQGTAWNWFNSIAGLQIGDRISQPNTHPMDGFISEPFVVPEF